MNRETREMIKESRQFMRKYKKWDNYSKKKLIRKITRLVRKHSND